MTRATDLSKSRLFLALAALFLSSMCTLGDLVVNPIVSGLYDIFAGSPEWLINFSITGPGLVGLPFGMIAGFLCDRFDKKYIMVIGFAIFTVSACFGAAVVDITYYTTLRCCATGIGWGITNTAALSILADLFTDEDEHGKYVGWYNAAMSVMGAIMSAIAGILAASMGWQAVFKVYWIAVPVLVMLIVFLPSFKPHAKVTESKEEDASDSVPSGWWIKLIPLTVQVFLIAACYFVMLYMISVFVTDGGVGDEAYTGMLTSISTIATAVASIIFGKVYAKLKSTVYIPFTFLIGLCFVAMAFSPTPIVTAVCVGVAGFCWPFYFCYFYVRCTELVPASKAGTATAIVAFSDGLACFACSYLLTFLIGATGGNAVTVWPIIGTALIVVTVVSVVYYFAFMRKKNA